jgi:membrane-associated phospholipid phosphatase
MRDLVNNNKTYFLLLIVFIVVGAVFLALLTKGNDILFFNAYRSPVANNFFRFATQMGEPPVYVLLGILALAYKFRYALLIALTGFIVLGLSHGLKMFFAIDRPAAFFQKLERIAEVVLVDGVTLHTGATSFPSGHTMSAFAIYSLLIFLLPKRRRIALVLFFLALLVGVSRVFLVQHFWPDVYVGALIGSALAIVVFLVQEKFVEKPDHWLDRPLFRVKKGA